MNIDYSFWREALAGKHPEMHADIPCPGYYYLQKDKGAARIPTAVFWNRGEAKLTALVGYNDLNYVCDPIDLWTWICNHPVSYESYHQCARTHEWPTEESHEFQRLLAVLNSLVAVLTDIDGAELESLAQAFEEARKKENEPYLRAKKAVDRRYQEQIDRIAEALKTIKQMEES